GEDGYALKEEGYNENYACENPQVVQSGQYPTTFVSGLLAKLHDIGKYNDPEVTASLSTSCGNCQHYRKR
ncbi:MAG: hypothetical protein G01um101416_854, partial [Microgenomates group bacterium Gr01-1014_16]